MFYQKQSLLVEHVSQKCWHDSSQRTLHSKIKVTRAAGPGVVTRDGLNSWSMNRQSSEDTGQCEEQRSEEGIATSYRVAGNSHSSVTGNTP